MLRPIARYITLLLSLALAPQAAQAQSDWKWDLTPYLWGADTTLDARVNDASLGGTLTFGDLLDKLDMALLLNLQGRGEGPFGMLADLTYISMSESNTLPAGRTIGSDVEVTIFDLAGTYALSDNADVLLGLRRLALDTSLSITPPGLSPSFDEALNDVLFGVRFMGDLADNWDYAIRLDGSGGDTEGTWGAMALFGYNFGNGDGNRLWFGYRHLEADTESDQIRGLLATDITFSGPIVGYQIRFR